MLEIKKNQANRIPNFISKIGIIAFALCLIFSISSFLKKEDPLKKLPKSIAKEYAFIPAGKVVLSKLHGDSLYHLSQHKFDRMPHLLKADTLNCQDFYISKYEVCNQQYQDFLKELRNSGNTELWKEALLDTLGWRLPDFYNEPYTEYYHVHPAYAHYPVVNVSKRGAELYCEWLESGLNSLETDFEYEVVLPLRKEWVRATRGDNHYDVYAWGGPMVKNKRSEPMCNMKHIGAEQVYFDEKRKEYAVIPEASMANPYLSYSNADFFITSPVDTYYPNEFGIYNLNGNVSEITSDDKICGGSYDHTGFDVRNESYTHYKESSPYQGFRPIIKIKENKTH